MSDRDPNKNSDLPRQASLTPDRACSLLPQPHPFMLTTTSHFTPGFLSSLNNNNPLSLSHQSLSSYLNGNGTQQVPCQVCQSVIETTVTDIRKEVSLCIHSLNVYSFAAKRSSSRSSRHFYSSEWIFSPSNSKSAKSAKSTSSGCIMP